MKPVVVKKPVVVVSKTPDYLKDDPNEKDVLYIGSKKSASVIGKIEMTVYNHSSIMWEFPSTKIIKIKYRKGAKIGDIRDYFFRNYKLDSKKDVEVAIMGFSPRHRMGKYLKDPITIENIVENAKAAGPTALRQGRGGFGGFGGRVNPYLQKGNLRVYIRIKVQQMFW